ncbi:RNA-DIRECTED DNA METHYLATION 1 [Striga asiatica]|uniref:RNA-DIRECTED DNA METHYLATION 1 n=1 Tax=Striga asiatica TaxID=4170 RepID=A0A5A7PN03_STRAF|nr:RNA-DIRECTED DNA METHYLATION 1 [Striga asiatica]
MHRCKPPHLQNTDVFRSQQLSDEPPELSPEVWLLRRAESYQEYMKLIPIPTERGTVIPFTSWTGLGSSIKQIYGQPLHYLTNLHLSRMDHERLGAEDTGVPLYMTIHPCKAEASIWIIEEAHRLTSSPHHLVRLWEADTYYHVYIDDIFPKLKV